MPTKIVFREQVLAFQRALAPAPRRALKAAILGLAHGRGDITALEDNLAGAYRLRVGMHRVVFRYAEDGSIICFFCERRALVYEVLSANLAEWLKPEK